MFQKIVRCDEKKKRRDSAGAFQYLLL